MNVKLFIATPAFDGKVNVPYAICLAETALLLAKNHIQIEYRIVTSGSLLCAERNRLLQSFIDSDCTHILCVDSDLGWPAQCVISMLQKNLPFVAGVYPARGPQHVFTFRPFLLENGSIEMDQQRALLRMENIPAGFMLIKREVIQKMMDDHPETKYVPKDPSAPSGFALFNTEIENGEFWGEDYVFCRRARESGFQIWVDPMIEFNHAGNIAMLMNALTMKKEDAMDLPPSVPNEK